MPEKHEPLMNARTVKEVLRKMYTAALSGANPRRCVEMALAEPVISRSLETARRVGVFAVGKAAAGMLSGARGIGSRGLAVLPRGYPLRARAGVEVLLSSHPEPDRSSLRAARRAIAFFESFGTEDAILCLVSGGASSLLELPRPGLTVAQLRRRVRRLSDRGASILEINRLRARLSAVKGGGLGRKTRARLITLVLSDVPGDRAAAVGSGPTIRGRRGDLVRVVGSNAASLAAAAEETRRRGLSPRFARERLAGEAQAAGSRLALRAKRLRAGEVLLAGGETTVTLTRRRGRGGRSLELALGAALEIEGRAGMFLLAAGSDGRDGSSRAAGAFVDGSTLARARRRGIDPAKALSRHSTEAFFEKLGDLLVTGPTGTNVADWVFALRV